jgi:hypothetical protein
MLDIFNIPGQQDNVKIFYAQSGSASWQTWQKPRNCKFIWMMCMGSGAGGGSSNATAGVGGGGSGAITRAIFPANVLPDILYIQPGAGGKGGQTNAASGESGSISFVSITPNSATAMNVVCASGTAPATSYVGGTAGAGETAVTTVVAGLLSLGNFISTAGLFPQSTLVLTPFTGTVIHQGVNGGGVGGNEGSTIASVDFGTFQTPQITGGTPANSGNPGADGIFSWKPFYSLGGAGGAASSTGAGGKGGNGGYGSGGGSAGGSQSGFTGIGGNGGDGLVIIATF